MMIEEYRRLDACGLAKLVRDGEVTAREAVDAALATIEAIDPLVGAVIETWPEEIEAALADTHRAAPFAGVPFLIKDILLHAAGRPSEAGSRLAKGMVFPHDTHLMTRFRGAGLVTLGRTKTPEFGFAPTTENVLHGPVRNPWDISRSAGGSSGGAAVAVSSGMVPVAHASDAGGSIRIPAAACGLVGLKPSRGRISLGPDVGEVLLGLGCEFIVSRSVRDTAAMLDAVHGAEPGDPCAIERPVTAYGDAAAARPARLRIGVMVDAWNGSSPDPEASRAVEHAAALCASLGHEVEEASPSMGVTHDAFVLANARVWCSGLASWAAAYGAMLGRPIDLTTLEASTLACCVYGANVTAVQLHEALGIFNQVCRSMSDHTRNLDVLITPTLPGAALPLGRFSPAYGEVDGLAWTARLFDASPYTPIFNVTGQPAISLPIGMTDTRLPVGVQFAAAPGREDLLIGLAAEIEVASPWPTCAPLHAGMIGNEISDTTIKGGALASAH